MRIAIDARAWGWTGIGRYTRNLVAEFEKMNLPHKFILLMSQEDAAQYSGKFETVVVENSYYSWAEQTKFLWQLNQVQADLFHFMHFNVPLLFNKPFAVTIHDTTRFIFPGQTSQSLLKQIAYEQIFSHAVRKAQRVIVVSHSTAHDLQELVPGAAAVDVVHEALDPMFLQVAGEPEKQKARALFGVNEPYLLYVGVWMAHKNLERLLAAFAETRETFPQLKLVMTGKPKPGYDNVLEQAKKLGLLDHIVFAGKIPESLLPAAYAASSGLVFPSLYEGFGLPALEAVSQNVPVLVSNLASFPEVIKTGGVFVNPESVKDISLGMVKMLRERPRATGLQITMRDVAQKHVAVYEA